MRTSRVIRASTLLLLASCGGGGGDDGLDSGGSLTFVVNESTFGATHVSSLTSHLTPPTVSTATLTFVVGPATPPIGEGSGQWSIGTDGDSGQELRFGALDGVPLANVTRLSFWTLVQTDTSGTPVVAVNLSMRIDWNGDGIEDDRIFFEPEYQHAYTVDVPDQGDLLNDEWQSWDALAGGWWSNNDLNFGPGVDVGLLADYVSAHPGCAVVTHTDGSGGTRLNAGYGAPAWSNFVGNADALEIGILGDVFTYDLDP